MEKEQNQNISSDKDNIEDASISKDQVSENEIKNE